MEVLCHTWYFIIYIYISCDGLFTFFELSRFQISEVKKNPNLKQMTAERSDKIMNLGSDQEYLLSRGRAQWARFADGSFPGKEFHWFVFLAAGFFSHTAELTREKKNTWTQVDPLWAETICRLDHDC